MCVARILLRRGNTEAAYQIMANIYPYAKSDEVDFKVRETMHTILHNHELITM